MASQTKNEGRERPFWNGGRLVETNMDDTWRDREVVIVAETGCDLPRSEAEKLGVYLVPMHVAFGSEERDDGTFPPALIDEYRRSSGRLPSTSASSPGDFRRAFIQARNDYPDRTILHLGYSAKTTAAFANACEAAKQMPGIVHFDTQAVAAAHDSIVRSVAQWIQEKPHATLMDALQKTIALSASMRFGFILGSLDYLKAGGRLSNAAFVGASILHMRPLIEVDEGLLVARKKIQGSMKKACVEMIDAVVGSGSADASSIFFFRSPGLSEEVAEIANGHVAELGCQNPTWYRAGGVTTVHCGPGSIGIGCFSG